LEIRGGSRKFGNRKASFNEITRKVKLLWKVTPKRRKKKLQRGKERKGNNQLTPDRRRKKLERGKKGREGRETIS